MMMMHQVFVPADGPGGAASESGAAAAGRGFGCGAASASPYLESARGPRSPAAALAARAGASVRESKNILDAVHDAVGPPVELPLPHGWRRPVRLRQRGRHARIYVVAHHRVRARDPALGTSFGYLPT